MVDFVTEARRQNRQSGKDLAFSVVTNLMVVTDEQLAWCQSEGISVSYTVNGPEDIHDHYRKTRTGKGSYAAVMRRLQHIQSKFPGAVASTPLCVIDAENAAELRRMIDFYYEAGFDGLSIVRLKHMGNARRVRLQFDVHQFLRHYLDGLEYIVEKNKGFGRPFRERMVPVVLSKIFGDSDVSFVDWRNPCGDISGAVTYDYDGEILPADEARSLRSEFGLGSVRGVRYEEFVHRKAPFRTMNLSLRDRDPECRECAYNPFCGVMPVLEYARTGNAVPRPFESEECQFTLHVLDWTFRKLLSDPVPLVRMVPGADERFRTLLATMAEQPASAAGVEGSSGLLPDAELSRCAGPA
jgi:radical SAM protein with 4Fe4S-binding SPASM domain